MSALKVHASPCDTEPMVQSEEIRREFVLRLKQALAHAGLPEWGAGVRLAEITKKTAKASSKWLRGESMPSRSNMIAIADWLKVRIEWLAHGEGGMHQGVTEERAPSDRVEIDQALLDLATPRSRAVLHRINQAASNGSLSEADIDLLDQIAARFEHKGAPRADGEGSHKRLREKLLNNDPHPKK